MTESVGVPEETLSVLSPSSLGKNLRLKLIWKSEGMFREVVVNSSEIGNIGSHVSSDRAVT